MKRYIDCNFIEKIWRSRWRLLTPIVALSIYRRSIKENKKNRNHWVLEYDDCNNIARSITKCRMNC
jgi:hypothetical protein